MKKISSIFLVFLFILLAFGRIVFAQDNEWDRKNKQVLFEQLRMKKAENAAKFMLYFQKNKVVSAEARAQYHLLLCQSRSAIRAAFEIKDISRRKLFLAVISSLISVDRWSLRMLQSQELRELNPHLDSDSLRTILENVQQDFVEIQASMQHAAERYNAQIDKNQLELPLSSEIWQDEWPEIQVKTRPCDYMPVVVNLQARKKYKQWSKALFSEIPQEYYLLDFNIASLAMDVGAEVPNPIAFLHKFNHKKTNPYYKRLSVLYGDSLLKLEKDIKVKRHSSFSAEFSLFRLQRDVMQVHIVDVPFLVDPRYL